MATRNPRYDILFEPIAFGPVVARNRFYQTPHATGLGYLKPYSSAALRGIKAEGGWGVVCTEYCSVHPSSDDSPYAFVSLWDEEDVRALAKTAEAIHRHGSLAGVELWHGGSNTNNRLTREPMLAPSARAAKYVQPGQARAMDKQDIANLRRWHRDAALRARRAGFDIVYVYASHDFLPFQYLSPLSNQRQDEYGGSLENRVRLIREMITDTKDAVGDRCAVAVRLAVDELQGLRGITHEGEGREVIALLAELPDLWDVNVGGSLANDSKSSRFSRESFQETYVAFVKSFTSKPVVGVGRFTSPETMVSQIKRGILDVIGAARPSIADPFLPEKINQGREDEIRECIGCNICRAANNEAVPLRCTQNPTIGEEWRRGWHPDRIAGKTSEERVLIVGGGPAGLECALALGQRGYEVILAEQSRALGGRVVREASLAGLAQWIRVRDYREHMLSKLPNVEIYRQSKLGVDEALETTAQHVVIATGSRWRRDGVGATVLEPAAVGGSTDIVTPDDVFSGTTVGEHVAIYDDEHYFMGGALAETLAREGHKVTVITPVPLVSSWTSMTDEQFLIQQRLHEIGVDLKLSHRLKIVDVDAVSMVCIYSDREQVISCDTLIMVTGRLPEDGLYQELMRQPERLADMRIRSVRRIGDCYAPSSIADAVFSGHRYAREFGTVETDCVIRRERPMVDDLQ
ncbi:MAG TPA: FAD-dependent oxidoreductase [Aestuariivirgaceae bacterium]|jgi:dimethylamine/trimethylamine dehydrogenase